MYWNRGFWQAYTGEPLPAESWAGSHPTMLTQSVVLPAGTVMRLMKIDFRPGDPYPFRFYVRKRDNPHLLFHGEIWVLLDDVNTMNVEIIT
jgi:hypothetical protein